MYKGVHLRKRNVKEKLGRGGEWLRERDGRSERKSKIKSMSHKICFLTFAQRWCNLTTLQNNFGIRHTAKEMWAVPARVGTKTMREVLLIWNPPFFHPVPKSAPSKVYNFNSNETRKVIQKTIEKLPLLCLANGIFACKCQWSPWMLFGRFSLFRNWNPWVSRV